ncbi:MAG TPA: type II toxin-antitoxin system VapC family toxin [Terriglobales bacterium]|nr:type II toxin-antitoxin system VapC family toxin [Terriglobales bacterium]
MILDTNALSAVADDVPGAVKAFRGADVIALPVIVLGEYRFGIAQSIRRSHYEAWLARLIGASRVLDVNPETTLHYVEVRLALKKLGRPIPSNDVWIAALSHQHSLPILSRDRHFDLVGGVTRLSW